MSLFTPLLEDIIQIVDWLHPLATLPPGTAGGAADGAVGRGVLSPGAGSDPTVGISGLQKWCGCSEANAAPLLQVS